MEAGSWGWTVWLVATTAAAGALVGAMLAGAVDGDYVLGLVIMWGALATLPRWWEDPDARRKDDAARRHGGAMGWPRRE